MRSIEYGIYLSKGSKTIRIPVNPPELIIQKNNDNQTYNVVGIGEVNVPRIPKPQVIEWESYFPAEKSAFTTGSVRDAEYYIDFLQEAMDDKEPIRLIINRYDERGKEIFDTNMKVLVSNFTYREKGGETGDFYYSIQLTEYRKYKAKTVQIQATPTQTTATVEVKRSLPSGEIVVGTEVVCNGKYFASSYGDSPSGNFNNYRGKVSRIVDGSRAYPYHIASLSGGWIGWVAKSQLQVV